MLPGWNLLESGAVGLPESTPPSLKEIPLSLSSLPTSAKMIIIVFVQKKKEKNRPTKHEREKGYFILPFLIERELVSVGIGEALRDVEGEILSLVHSQWLQPNALGVLVVYKMKRVECGELLFT